MIHKVFQEFQHSRGQRHGVIHFLCNKWNKDCVPNWFAQWRHDNIAELY